MRSFLLGLACVTALQAGIAIEWQEGRPRGEIRVIGARITSRSTPTPSRLQLVFESRPQDIVSVADGQHTFSFFLRDVNRDNPILIPAYGVAVTEDSDSRSYGQIEVAVRSRGLQSKLERISAAPEENFANAARESRSVTCQTWLGLGRDIRIFAVSDRLDWVETRLHGKQLARHSFQMGRGWGPLDRITRRLEDGVLPILHGTLDDEDVTYELTAFAALEAKSLTAANVRGTHFLIADGHGAGHMFTKEQQAQYDSLLAGELNQPEETVLFVRMTAVNTAPVPRYAFFKTVPVTAAVSKLNGQPLAEDEVSILLQPGRIATVDTYLPNRPLTGERAERLRRVSFAERLAECRAFWKAKLASAAQIRVPERRIDEMARAGLLHLDLITYGLEPEGTLTSTIGVYSAIGSESSPIIQFMDSMGRHEVARRALMYFLDKQHDDGFIQNFGGYMLETGAALWSMGEHYRYTRDDAWVRQIAPKLIKACEYLRQWRARNLREDLRGRGYGMLEGKTADPEDPFHSFMLNGYAYLGLSRVAEMLARTDPQQSRRWQAEASALRDDIRAAAAESMGRAPVIPLAGGAWCPTLAPWAEYRGPLALHGEGGKWFTHGAMISRDSLLGPLYLPFQEVLDPSEQSTTFLLDFHNDLMTRNNAAFSQPYYSRHPIVHLRRGEVKPFLKAYYNTVAALADRQTYTFWEHYFGASPHKTHEEGWFLMDTRWMLWMERGSTLELLAGAPRAWLEDGQRIELDRVASYFGPLTVRVESKLNQGRLEAAIECPGDRKPRAVEIRLPHPLGRKAVRVAGGRYDAARESVHIEPFDGMARVTIAFNEEDTP